MTQATLQDVYDELKEIKLNMASKEEVESLRDTVEILCNPVTMKQISASLSDIKLGKTKKVTSVKEMIDEMDK